MGLIKLETRLSIKEKDKARLHSMLERLLSMFGPKGEYWIKEEEHVKDYFNHRLNKGFTSPVDMYCLIGVAKADRKFEADARLILSMAMRPGFALCDEDEQVDAITSFNDRDTTSWADIKKLFKKAHTLVDSSTTVRG